MEAISNATALFVLVLALSLLIERFLEVLKSFYDLLDSRYDLCNFWSKQSERIKKNLEKKLGVYEYVDPKGADVVLNRFSELLLNGQTGYSGTVPLLGGDMLRVLVIKIGCKVIGMGIGVALAWKYKIDLVELWQNGQALPAAFSQIELLAKIEKFLTLKPVHIILSGIAIGLGSAPVHKIITSIERRRGKQAQKGGVS